VETDLVCVICGEPWEPPIKNRCECGGFCTWGYAKGADPLSWHKTEGGLVPNPPNVRDTVSQPMSDIMAQQAITPAPPCEHVWDKEGFEGPYWVSTCTKCGEDKVRP
jgi:hypothetical protein